MQNHPAASSRNVLVIPVNDILQHVATRRAIVLSLLDLRPIARRRYRTLRARPGRNDDGRDLRRERARHRARSRYRGIHTRTAGARSCGVAERDITLIEYGWDFVPLLQGRFPQARVLQMDAAKLNSRYFRGERAPGAIISGLPLLAMSTRKVMSILTGAFDCLRDKGAFYQFTYGPRCPVRRPLLDRLGLKAARVGHALINVPPAAVYRITRRNPLKRAQR